MPTLLQVFGIPWVQIDLDRTKLQKLYTAYNR